MTPATNHPWWADVGDDAIVIRDKDGAAVCEMQRPDDINARTEQDAVAELVALAPELFARLHELARMVHCCDPEYVMQLEVPHSTDADWDVALEDAQALLDLLAEAGVTMEVSQ